MGTRAKGKASGHPGLYKRGRYWWLTKDPVTGKAESTRCTTLAAAKAYQGQRELEAMDPSYAAPGLGEQCARFVQMKADAGRSTATLGYFGEKLGHWVRVFGQGARLGDVGTPESFDLYVQQRKQEGASSHTISKEVRVFCQVLKMAKRVGQYGGDITVLKPHDLTTSYVPRERAMTTAEVAALHAELQPRTAALLDVSVALGVRLSEAQKLAPTDIDLERGTATIRGTKTKASSRTVPILSLFRPMLERALPALPIGGGNNLYRSLRAACKRAGVAYATPNDWRRSHATILAEHGVDRDVVRRLLGHTSTQMVDRVYSRPRPEALGSLAESAIASRRSSGVAEDIGDGPGSSDDDTCKYAEPLAVAHDGDVYSGFLSRRSHVRIVPGAQQARCLLCGQPAPEPERSRGVVSRVDDPADLRWAMEAIHGAELAMGVAS